jgi:hypothetical protein
MLFLGTFAQDDQFYEYVSFHIYNSDHEVLENAQVNVDGKNIPFDSRQKIYFLKDTFKIHFNVTVTCEGYDTISYSRSNFQSFHKSFFSGIMWLIKPTEKFYYVGAQGLKMSYTQHPDKLLVILDSRKYSRDDSLWVRFENEIKQHGLKVNHSFIEVPTDPTEQWMYNSHVGLEYRLIIQKEDETDFESDYCKELGYLRELDMVKAAGPLLILGGKSYNVVTYDNRINIYQPSTHYESKEINQIVNQIDDRFYYDDKTHSIILPKETNELVPRIFEQLKEIDFKGRISMMVYPNTVND